MRSEIRAAARRTKHQQLRLWFAGHFKPLRRPNKTAHRSSTLRQNKFLYQHTTQHLRPCSTRHSGGSVENAPRHVSNTAFVLVFLRFCATRDGKSLHETRKLEHFQQLNRPDVSNAVVLDCRHKAPERSQQELDRKACPTLIDFVQEATNHASVSSN